VFVLLVDVDEPVLVHHAEETAPRILLLGEENRRPIMICAVDRQTRVRHLLLRIHKEGIIHNLLRYVALHVLGLATIICQLVNNVHYVFFH